MDPPHGPVIYNAYYGEYATGQPPNYTMGNLTHVFGPSHAMESSGAPMYSAGPHPTGDDGRPNKRPIWWGLLHDHTFPFQPPQKRPHHLA